MIEHILEQAAFDKDDIVKGHAEASLALLHNLRYSLVEEYSGIC